MTVLGKITGVDGFSTWCSGNSELKKKKKPNKSKEKQNHNQSTKISLDSSWIRYEPDSCHSTPLGHKRIRLLICKWRRHSTYCCIPAPNEKTRRKMLIKSNRTEQGEQKKKQEHKTNSILHVFIT